MRADSPGVESYSQRTPTDDVERELMRALKRLLDATVAAVALVVLLPVLAAVGLAIRLRMGSPILFRQVRPGLHGAPFTLVKFRTMRPARAGEEELATDARRLTGLGRFLRRYSLDELSQLWNVLRGDMSLVGPRPLLMRYLDRYTAEQFRRHEVRPGITGWAQVRGRNAVSWDARLAMDIWYVDNWSLALDAHILLETIARVVMRDGISQPGHATMPEFMGTSRSAANGK